jgi:hypothetical protein
MPKFTMKTLMIHPEVLVRIGERFVANIRHESLFFTIAENTVMEAIAISTRSSIWKF